MGETFCGTPTEQSRTQLYLVTEEVSHLPLAWSLLVCWPSSHPHTGIILQFSHCTALYCGWRVWAGVVWRYLLSPLHSSRHQHQPHSLYLYGLLYCFQSLQLFKMCNSLNDQPKRKVLHVLGKTILKLFIQKSIQQNVQIDMITADARSSNVLHDTRTIANTPGPTPTAHLFQQTD